MKSENTQLDSQGWGIYIINDDIYIYIYIYIIFDYMYEASS